MREGVPGVMKPFIAVAVAGLVAAPFLTGCMDSEVLPRERCPAARGTTGEFRAWLCKQDDDGVPFGRDYTLVRRVESTDPHHVTLYVTFDGGPDKLAGSEADRLLHLWAEYKQVDQKQVHGTVYGETGTRLAAPWELGAT